MNVKTSIMAASLVCFVLVACASRPRVQARKPTTMVYFLRVVDGESQAPVKEAKISVVLKTPAKPSWSGLTDAGGFFQFTWNAKHDRVEAHISVQAPGFASFENDSQMIPDKLIQLQRDRNDSHVQH